MSAHQRNSGEILFDKMGLEGGKKGKTGKYSTGADILEDLATEHELPRSGAGLAPAVQAEIDLYGCAPDPYQRLIPGRVHTSYSITGANTGRLASTDPNLQNIPVRTEEGTQAFVKHSLPNRAT